MPNNNESEYLMIDNKEFQNMQDRDFDVYQEPIIDFKELQNMEERTSDPFREPMRPKKRKLKNLQRND